jgi:uncharacterized protein (TIGR00369 family)
MPEEIDFELELAEIGRPSGFRSLIGYKTIEWREGYGEILLRLEPKHMNARMIPHGGLYMAVMDSAMGHAATYCPVPGHHRRCVTVGFQTNFLAPAAGAYLRARAWLVSAENRIATCRGEVVDAQGTLCAAAQGSFRYMRGSEHLEGVPDKPR